MFQTFCGRILATIIPKVIVLPAGTFSLGIKKMLFVPDGILVPNTCVSRTIPFANEFSQITLVGPLIRCLYYSYAPVIGSMKNFLDDVPTDLSLVLQRSFILDPLFFPALWYCTGVFLTVGHICFLCSGCGVPSLVTFFVYLPLFLLMVDLPGLD